MQRALTNSEHDRKIMAERLEALKAAQQDAKSRNNAQQDRMQQMKNEQADSEVRELCMQLDCLDGVVFYRKTFRLALCSAHACFHSTQ